MALFPTRAITLAAALAAMGWCTAPGQAASSILAALENPQPHSFQSGIGLLSGWSCTGPNVSMVIDNKITLAMPYGSARTDTASVCGAGNTNSGFGLLINFNTLGQGFHTASLFVNGENVGDTQFAVTVPNGEFISGAAKDVTVFDFPVPGASTTLTWQQSQQNFAVKSVVGVTTTTTGSGTTTTGNGTTTTGGTTTSTVEGATTTTMDLDAAKKLYTTYCVCHQPWERSGYNAQQVRDAINRVPDMSLLSFLTDDQLIGIAAYMNQEEFHHPP